jgi:hypothetical protein
MHPAALPPDEFIARCQLRFVRRSGPGGQHRNKVSTGVVACDLPTGTLAEASERRSQAQNRALAIFRLRVNLAIELRSQPDVPPPSPLWRSRSGGGQIHVSPQHDDFPALLAEALDAISLAEGDVKTAGETLACTPSQLIKLLKKEPRALQLVNGWRARRGLPPLK